MGSSGVEITDHDAPRRTTPPAEDAIGQPLAGRQVMVVGASSGVGRATADLVASCGAAVLLVSRRADALRDAAEAIGAAATWAAADMTDLDAMRRAVATVGRVDHVVVTAVADELRRAAPVTELTPDQVERSFDRLRGYVTVVQAVHPALSERATLTFWSGVSAHRPPASGFALLAAENAAIGGFVRALARELAPVRTNLVMSGVVDTPIHDDDREDLRSWAEADLPARRLGSPQDLAHAALFTMTNPYLTGQTVVVDGGLSLV